MAIHRGNGGKLREEALIPLLVAGAWVHGERPLVVRSPYDGRAVGTTSYATPEQVERAVRAAVDVAAEAAALPVHARRRAGPDRRGHRGPGRWARRDDHRGERQALAWARGGGPGGVGVPLGGGGDPYLVRGGDAARHRARRRGPDRLRAPGAQGSGAGDLAVQLPLNLVAHKVAPALAVGAPVLLKPARRRRSPRCCWRRSWRRPTCRRACSAWSWSRTTARPGSSPTRGCRWSPSPARSGGPRDPGRRPAQARRARARRQRRGRGLRRLRRERDLDWAATRIAAFGTYQAGQSCISVQRVYADTTVYDDLRDRVVKAVGALRTGDPADPPRTSAR